MKPNFQIHWAIFNAWGVFTFTLNLPKLLISFGLVFGDCWNTLTQHQWLLLGRFGLKNTSDADNIGFFA